MAASTTSSVFTCRVSLSVIEKSRHGSTSSNGGTCRWGVRGVCEGDPNASKKGDQGGIQYAYSHDRAYTASKKRLCLVHLRWSYKYGHTAVEDGRQVAVRVTLALCALRQWQVSTG